MLINNSQAQYLMGLKKKILIKENAVETVTIQQSFPVNFRYEIVAVDDDEFTFLWEVKQSDKNSLRISLHCQEDDSKIGLFRVDYNSGHKNPESATSVVPKIFKPYIGKWFDDSESHVHYHVEGYRSLAWAVPIGVTDIAVKDLAETEFYRNLSAAIISFAKIANIETKIIINEIAL